MIAARAAWVGAVAISVAVVAGATISAGAMPYAAAGAAYLGLVQALCSALLRALAMVAGAVTVGALVYIVSCTETTASGRVGVDGYTGFRIVERAATVWAVVAAARWSPSLRRISGVPRPWSCCATASVYGRRGAVVEFLLPGPSTPDIADRHRPSDRHRQLVPIRPG